ncbi:TonB-dependent receptor [Duganella hordei]|uniref:TonB-dependent receptor n=1 Tax=Duganella hordei TaxID=2865934 RepID=UPI0030E94606
MNSTATRSPMAAAIALCCAAFAAAPVSAQVAAQVTDVLAPVVITGARFDSNAALTPIGATVISADEIRRAGVSDVNSAIRKIGGVYGRQSLDGSPDFTLDMRGFGTNSAQNVVVVVNGVRLSENELANPILSSIPIDSVERIEISRGGASVLYGEGATGGVINIVTKRPAANSHSGSMFVEGGQFHEGEIRGSYSQAWNGFAADVTAGHQRTDNYRDNNDFKLSNFSGGLQWFDANSRMGVRYDGSRSDSRFAGSLKEAEFLANPRRTTTPRDFGSVDTDRVTGFYNRHIGSWDIATELSHREKTSRGAYFSSDAYLSESKSRQTQFSPRVRQLSDVAGMLNEVVAGMDFMRWNRTTDSSYGGYPTSNADATQRSKAFYVRDEIRFDSAHEGRVAAGVRRELFDKDFSDPLGYASTKYSASQGLNAWDVLASYKFVPEVDVFAKAGQSYRVANSDENAVTPNANEVLKPQVSHDLELGATYGTAGRKVTARLFRHKLTNEIFYDPTLNRNAGANANLDPTERKGFELDGEIKVAADWTVSAHYQHVKAEFTDGPNNGKEMVLVPKNVLSARVSWTPASGQTADFGAQWVDGQRFGDDFTNSCSAEIPGFTTYDARYARRFGQWELAVSGLNLTDKYYYSQAFRCRDSIYPGDGRQLKLSARYDF